MCGLVEEICRTLCTMTMQRAKLWFIALVGFSRRRQAYYDYLQVHEAIYSTVWTAYKKRFFRRIGSFLSDTYKASGNEILLEVQQYKSLGKIVKVKRGAETPILHV